MTSDNRNTAYERLEYIRSLGFSDTEILDEAMCYLSGDQNLEIINDFADTNGIDFDNLG